MRLLYEARNGIEAQMILDLLQQDGLTARVDGEYLQGGIGELQAMGVVRVMIAEEDYLGGRQVIDRWDAQQAERVGGVPASTMKGGIAGPIGVLIFVLGLVLGVGLMAIFV